MGALTRDIGSNSAVPDRKRLAFYNQTSREFSGVRSIDSVCYRQAEGEAFS
jgi:hypothetical protein